MTEREAAAKAKAIMTVLQRFLLSEKIRRLGDMKNSVAGFLELYGREAAAEMLRDCYTVGTENPTLALVGSDAVLIDRASGVEVMGCKFSWAELAGYVQEMMETGKYMTPSEERTYRQQLPEAKEMYDQHMLQLVEDAHPETRGMAARKYGLPAWERLMNDPKSYVRVVVAYYSDAKFKLRMIHDPDPIVRAALADRGDDTVREALLDAGETDISVLSAIAQRSSPEVQMKLIGRIQDSPGQFRAVAYKLGIEAKKQFLQSKDPHVAVLGIEAADQKQCEALLSRKDLDINEEFLVQVRLQEIQSEPLAVPVL